MVNMEFGRLAKYLEKLEGISSRLEMTRVIAELFGETTAQDARLVAYISQGHLGPAYRSPDFGLGDKMMLKALGGEAEKIFKEVGDLGKVAEKVRVSVTVSHLTIDDVYKKLWEVAEIGGTGSTERKAEAIRSLLDGLDGISAKYVVKMVLGKLRTGFSDMTVLDALSWMVVGDKSLRPKIEQMYNVRADLGEIAEMIKSIRVEELESVSVEPELGTPVLMARAERAVSAEDIWERNGITAVEHKLDGLRIQAHISLNDQSKKVELFSRGLENVTSMYPDVVEGLAEQVEVGSIVEGEMIAVGEKGNYLPFQETVQRKRKYGIAEMSGKIPLKIFLFDVLVAKGKTVMEEENSKRRQILQEIVTGEKDRKKTVQLMPRITANSVEEIEDYFSQSLAAGTEGIVAKKMDGPYQAGARDFNWIKYKKSYDKSTLNDTIDAVVMGYDAGQGKRSDFGIGDFLIGIYDGKLDKYLTVAKIGTGLTDEEWRKMKKMIDEIKTTEKPDNFEVNKIMNVDVWCKPKIVVEVKADEITKSPMHTSGLALRFPRLVSWREKRPEDATSLKEIEDMAKAQVLIYDK